MRWNPARRTCRRTRRAFELGAQRSREKTNLEITLVRKVVGIDQRLIERRTGLYRNFAARVRSKDGWSESEVISGRVGRSFQSVMSVVERSANDLEVGTRVSRSVD